LKMAPQLKRRKLAISAVQEITFDPDAREEYLTGFHKRKLQRAKHAQQIAEKKAREERKEHRRKIREKRNAEIQRVIEENKARVRELDGSSTTSSEDEGNLSKDVEEWEGFPEPPAVDYEAEYIDEDKYTTVTVEEVDVLKDGLYKVEADEEDQDETGKSPRTENRDVRPAKPKKRVWTQESPNSPKRKRKKFRYEGKAERKITRFKERSRKNAKARARRSQ